MIQVQEERPIYKVKYLLLSNALWHDIQMQLNFSMNFINKL